MKVLISTVWLVYILSGCSVTKQVAKESEAVLLNDSAISTGHIGISLYEPGTGKYWYNYNASHYFIPASNTKLFSLYAGMKYLGDSLTGIYYTDSLNEIKVIGNADPTFLHPDFKVQPVFDFLKTNAGKKISLWETRPVNYTIKSFEPLGRGWAWDDFNSSYMAERNFFPIYGNVARFKLENKTIQTSPAFFQPRTFLMDKEPSSVYIERMAASNTYFVYADHFSTQYKEVPIKFGMDQDIISVEDSLLSDTLHQTVDYGKMAVRSLKGFRKIHSQPADSLFKPMMHNSDNFFAEQTLLMASNEVLGFMSDEKIIDTILKSSLKGIPQKPKWVDGSGLSRYNLFTPQDFIYLLNKMKDEFGMDRMKLILATGGEGTLSSYYKKDAGYIYAKTGTLSNNCALSGFLITGKGKLLIFSILANNYITGATPVRRAVERFLEHIREKY